MKRTRHPSSSEDSDNGIREYQARKEPGKSKERTMEAYCLRTRERWRIWTYKDVPSGNSTSWSQHSKSHPRRGKGKKPSEVFRTDLITAMKVHDSHQLNMEDFYVLADPWRQEWEKGVQVPVSPESIPQPVARVLADKGKEIMFTKPKKLIRTSGSGALGYVDIITLANGMCRYDLNEEDVAWLQLINEEFCEMGMPVLDEMTMERVMEEFERRCYDNMSHAVETEEGLGIEYDEDVVCDVCQSPDGEDNNEMVFCDKCNICVHQACYGIQKVPEGSWLCRICALGIVPKCQLCPKKGGAMKPTRSGTKWVHVSCALWIPEVSIGNPEKMEPITNVSHIPSNRWALICCLCKEKTGACIQCLAKNCRTAFHVTCGLHRSLEMNTILTEEDEVKFKAYCPKHSGLEGSECRDADSGDEEEEEGVRDQRSRRRGRVRGDADKAMPATPATLPTQGPEEPEGLSSRQQEEKRVNLRKLKLEQLEEEFFQFVDVREVAEHLKLSKEAVDFLYQYWKLKRKGNFNQPLLTPKKDEEESLARREQDVLLRRLQLFTHLRQDLERVRNLTYMVTRREKMKRSLWRVREQIFQHQIRLLEQELLAGEMSTENLKDISSLSFMSAQGAVTKRGSLKKDRKKGGHKRSAVIVPHGHRGEKEDPRRPLEEEDGSKEVNCTRLQKPEEVRVNCTRLQNPEEVRVNCTRLQNPEEVRVKCTRLQNPEEVRVNCTRLQNPEEVQVNYTRLQKPEEVRVNCTRLQNPEEVQVNYTRLQKPEEVQVNYTRLQKPEEVRVNCTRLQNPEEVQVNRLQKPEEVRVNCTRLQNPEEVRLNCTRLQKPEEERSVKREWPFPDLHHRRVSVVLTRLKPGNELHMEERRKKRSGLRDRSPVKTKTRPGTSAEDSLDGASTQPAPVSTTTKPNGWLRRDPCTQANGSLLSGRAAGSHLKNWGKFRIPKRTGRPLEVREHEVLEPPAPQQRKPLLRPLTNTSEPSYPRTRFRTGTENSGYAPDAKPSEPEGKRPCMKRCHSHQLRGGDSLCRRYCSDIIRRGVLIDV